MNKNYNKYIKKKEKEKKAKNKYLKSSYISNSSYNADAGYMSWDKKKNRNRKLIFRSHIIIDDNKLRNTLMIVAASLLIAVSVFTLIFQIARVGNMNNLITGTEKRIEKLHNDEENIDVTKAEYFYDKMFNQKIYNTATLTLMLSNYWHYELKVNGSPVTGSNVIVDKGTVTVELTEIMDDNILPFIISSKGNICGGDFNDDITSFFYNFDIDKIYVANADTKTVNGINHYKVNNSLKYTFIKGDEDVTFKVSQLLSDKLGIYFENNTFKIS